MAEKKATTAAKAAAPVAVKPTPAAKPEPVAPVEEAPTAPQVTEAGAWNIPIPEGAELGGMTPGTFISCCELAPTESVSSKGDAQTEFTFTVHDPAYPDLDGRNGKYWCSRKPKSWWNMTNTLDAMGVPYVIEKDANDRPINFKFNPNDCIGKWCKTVWEESTFNNKIRTKITSIIGLNESAVESSGSSKEDPGEAGGDDIPF